MPQVLISAHRMGAGGDRARENTLPALEDALDLGVDYIEFDVWRRDDGTFVVAHDPDHDVGLSYNAVLEALAGRGHAHIDLKFGSPRATYDGGQAWEVDAVRLAVELLGPDQLIVTTGHDRGVRAVRDWADAAGVELRVGLSLGRSVRRLSWLRRIQVRRSELFPHVRIRESRANLVVAHHVLARLGVAAYARRRGLPLLVWTVDDERSLRYWLRPGRAWMLTTNQPALALHVRDA
ncbi:MAG TPA: glycerophosphodiester phosphodiesterase [Nocardioides sp.]|uniref:glycerophosphodiester phosphodiesterase n=1 Tax=uncultured Nocardioides sp. TaxID=198441 RepID=UPI002633E0BE|nr:glycerophosphodiester phosphodiesterase [uncultured Nocardioides sp.]HRD62347.1 glycerophosphodiester phosphodiesterase [Nocardioides sp.]HRI97912.1 glycerophosphodiester phosphodiesterase [Nocardioides sp.]HRK47569.1 glycerophosphodiester phosphodiesterase [Nocardioides sp.]